MSPSIRYRPNFLFLLVFFLTINVNDGDASLADSWITFVKESKSILHNCMKNVSHVQYVDYEMNFI